MKFLKNKGYRKSIHVDDIIKEQYQKLEIDLDFDVYRAMCRSCFEMAYDHLNDSDLPIIRLPKLGTFQPVMYKVYTLIHQTTTKYNNGVIRFGMYKERIKTLIKYVKKHYVNGRRKGK